MSIKPSVQQGRSDARSSGVRSVAVLAHLHLLKTDLERATIPPDELSAATAVVQHLISLCTAGRFPQPVVLPALDSIAYIAEIASRAAVIKAMVVTAHEWGLSPPQAAHTLTHRVCCATELLEADRQS